VLVVTLDTLGAQMAGPAIRAWEISSHLAREHDVRLVTFARCDREADGFRVEHVEVGEFRAAVDWADVVVLQGYVAATFPWLRTADVVLVCDLYDPFHIESLEVQKDDPLDGRDASLASALRELDAQIARADFFLCASARQRDLWIGHLAAAGRLNPLTYDDDPTLDRLIAVVPFGTAPEPPVQRRHAVKGVVPGIGPDDKVVLWGGGVYNWFDPVTLVRAIDRVRHEVPEVRLYFLGMKHPNPDVPAMRVAAQTRALSDELGLTGSFVFFNEEWVPYADRADHLLDADVGVTCHHQHVETEFSFRTRVLDYLWAGLPIVTTAGDAFAELVAREDLGAVVPPEDVDALAGALTRLLGDTSARAAHAAHVREVAPDFAWPRVLEPLAAFVREPHRAADAERVSREDPAPSRAATAGSGLRSDVRAAVRHLRDGGPRQLLAKVRWRLARLRAR
jgi:glycosyltransferase involved in cell wall biosynthesis